MKRLAGLVVILAACGLLLTASAAALPAELAQPAGKLRFVEFYSPF